MNTTNLKGVMENQDIKGSFFKIQTIFLFKCLRVAFIKYTLLYTKP